MPASSPFRPRAIRILLALVCSLLPWIAGCRSTGPVAGTATPVPVAGTATPVPVATQPSRQGQVIPLDVGGAIEIPEGALPAGAQVSVRATRVPPLPDGVQALGEALAVTATGSLSTPATVRLPIPQGTSDASDLVIIRVDALGATTFLMTEVVENMLVAQTPGFSTLIIGKLVDGVRLFLMGERRLVPGQRETFYVRHTQLEHPRLMNLQGATWTATGGISLVYESVTAAVIEAGPQTGRGSLSYEFVDLARGWRWFGSKSIIISADAETSSGRPFHVSLVTRTPVALAGEEVAFTAAVYGNIEPPIAWRWDYGDGDIGKAVTSDAATSSLELPPKRYAVEDQAKTYSAMVWARDAQGRESVGMVELRVYDPVLQVVLDGPQRLAWSGSAASSGYDASVSGGQAPYRYSWLLSPGGERRDISDFQSVRASSTSSQVFVFNEPGEYRLEVTATDNERATSTAILPILVEGGEPLQTHMLDLPAAAKPGERVVLTVQVRGGVLAVAGKKAGYTLRVNWGDRNGWVVEEDVGITRTSYQGAVVPVSHSYLEAGTYEVRVEALDAVGSSTDDVGEITVAETTVNPTIPAPAANTPPTAENLVVATGQDTAVPVTLKGADEDGDDLSYEVLSGPFSGSLSGTAPFLTYTPESGFAGSDSFTYVAHDGQAGSAAATVSITVNTLRWVRAGAPVLNAEGARLEYYGGGSQPDYFSEPRFEGKFVVYSVSETSIAVDARDVDRGYEYYNVTIGSRFDAPQAMLTPGEAYTLTVQFDHSGTVTEGNPGATFWYSADRQHSGSIQPSQAFDYWPWSSVFSGETTSSWTLVVPQGRPGDTFQIYAGWWNCPVCNVTWTYQAE